MLFGVCLGGFVGEMLGVEMVGVGDVRVMRGFFVRTGVVMFRRLLVMMCRVFVMFCASYIYADPTIRKVGWRRAR